MVLNRKEKALLNIVYKTAVNKNGQCLLTPLDILQKIPYKLEFTENDLDKVLNDLALDDYFTVDKAKHHGEIVYVLALKEKGLSYIRDKKKARKKLYIRIITAILIAIMSFIIKWILDKIF
ncbi:MAG: hypothetical protein QM214_03825 [Bacillota bacterium]|jgi:hypothetical protein|nr:hypothetical protein [Bacillota bacterium]HHU43879.1 hypothetical protein [Clostridiales bacterium]